MIFNGIKIKGFNLGGWLLMEGYILGGRNIAESVFKRRFIRCFGKKELDEFQERFRETFITREDFKRIAALGARCLRVPFHYRLIERRPYQYCEEGLKYLDNVFSWAK